MAPAAIEEALRGSRLVAQAVVVGDDSDAVGVLIVPTDALDIAGLHREVERLTADLAAYERPRRVAILPRPLTAADGEIGADGSPQRATILAHFAELVASLNGSP